MPSDKKIPLVTILFYVLMASFCTAGTESIEPSFVLERLKAVDAAFAKGFTVSGTRKRQGDVIPIGQMTIAVIDNFRLSFDSDKCGYVMEMLEYEKPKFQLPKNTDNLDEDGWLIFGIRTRQWGYWGNDLSGLQYEDTVFKLSPENELVELGKSYNRSTFGPKDESPNAIKNSILWSLGRFFSKNIDEITSIKESTDGRIVVSAIGKRFSTISGRWELVIEPTAAWIVREARFYSDAKPDVIVSEMTNSGTIWSGSYCIPQKALYDLDSSINDESDLYLVEITFNQDIEQFDDQVYSDAEQSVTKNHPPKLTIFDYRVSPPLTFQLDNLLGTSLVDSNLPDMNDITKDFNIQQTKGRKVLVCFFDIEQRPSRNCMIQLSQKVDELKAQEISVIAIHISKIEKETLDEWLNENNIDFTVGMIEAEEENIRFNWGVKSLPWLILTDTNHIVTAEGFSINELDEKIKG